MGVRDIVTIHWPILRAQARSVEKTSPELQHLIIRPKLSPKVCDALIFLIVEWADT